MYAGQWPAYLKSGLYRSPYSQTSTVFSTPVAYSTLSDANAAVAELRDGLNKVELTPGGEKPTPLPPSDPELDPEPKPEPKPDLEPGTDTEPDAEPLTVSSSLQDRQTVRAKVRWEATVRNGVPRRVEFLVDGAVRWTEWHAPYRFGGDSGSWDTRTEEPGMHELTVRAVHDGGAATATARVTVAKAERRRLRFARPPRLALGTRSVVLKAATRPGTVLVSTIRNRRGALLGRARGTTGNDGTLVERVKLQGWRGCRCLKLTTRSADGKRRATTRVGLSRILVAKRPRVRERGVLKVWGSAPPGRAVRVTVRGEGKWIGVKRTKAQRSGGVTARVGMSRWKGQRRLVATLGTQVRRGGKRVWTRDSVTIRLTAREMRALRRAG